MTRPVASIEIQAKSTGLAGQLREARAKVANFADSVGRTMYRGFGKLGGMFGKKSPLGEKGFLGGAARTAAGNLMSGAVSKATDFIENIGEATFEYQDRLKRLQIQADATPASIDELSKSIRKASDETGLSKSKILAGSEAFVTLTGRMDIAKEASTGFARIAQATGSEVSDIATTGAAAFQNLGIQAKDFEAMFSGMAAQGKMGAVELKDLATELSTIAPQWAQFNNGKGLQGARELGSALQIVKRGFGGDAAETVTGLNNFLTAVQKKGSRFRDLGIGSFFKDVGHGKKQLRSVFEIVDMISKSSASKNGDGEALTKAFGSSEAYRAFIQLRDGRKDLEAFNRAGMDGGLIQRDFANYMESSGAKMKRSLEVLKNKIADVFTPERIEKFADMIERAADKVGQMAGALGKLADLAGGVEHVGENIRKFFGGDGHKEISQTDMYLAQSNGFMVGRNNAPDAMAARVAGAKSRVNDVIAWNNTVDSIMGKERDEKSTPESIAAAKAAYYNAERNQDGQVAYKGAGEAAQIYLRNAKADLTLGSDTTTALGGGAGAVSGALGGGPEIALKILAELKKLNEKSGDTEVKVGSDTVAKASKQSPTHRAAVAK